MRSSITIFAALLIALAVVSMASADDDAEIKLPLVTLQMKSARPKEIIAAFSKQTGIKFTDPGDDASAKRRINIDIRDKTFSEALNEVGTRCRLEPAGTNEDGEISLSWGGKGAHIFGKRPASVGPFATFLIDSISRESSLSLDAEDPQSDGGSSISLKLYVDPRLQVLRCRASPDIETCDDDNGDSILHADQNSGDASVMNAVSPGWEFQSISIPLEYDAQKSRKLAHLKGSLIVTAAASMEKFQVDDLQQAKGAEKSVDGLRAVIEDVADAEDETDPNAEHSTNIQLVVYREGLGEDQWESVMSRLMNTIVVRDARGKVVNKSVNESNSDESKTTCTITSTWKEPADCPAKFEVLIPTKLQDIELPFEFHDLKLP